MNTYDPQKAARVWQRVQEHSESKPRDLPGKLREMIMNEWLCAASYISLARRMGQREAAALQKLAREEQNHCSCLRGIYHLITGEDAPSRWPQPGAEAPEVTLRRCYGSHMRSLKEYEAISQDPEYGPVFARLAHQERDQCRGVLEVIGSVGKPGSQKR